jgi:hypothetical protein
MTWKHRLFVCCWCCAIAPGGAWAADTYENCARIAEPRARLACFDGVRAAAPSPSVPSTSSPSASASASLFGLRHAKTALQRITAGVKWYSFNERGKFTVGLDNGQIWRQFNDDTGAAIFTDEPASNRVMIKHGFFESYDLRLNRMNAVFRVERIK